MISKKEAIIFGIIFLSIISLIYAIPLSEFTNPTPANATSTTNTSIEINVSITEANLNEIIYNWNGTNFTMYNDSLKLMFNFDNVSALGENDTHVFDISGSNNNGTVTGATVSASGKYGGTFDFDGSADFIGAGDIIFDGATRFSVAFWAKVDDLTKDNTFLSKGAHYWNVPVLFWRDESTSNPCAAASDTVTLLVSTGSTDQRICAASGSLNDNNWHFYTGTFLASSSTGLNLYLDGKKAAVARSTTSITSIESSSDTVRLGAPTPTSNTKDLNGMLDNYMIFDRVLSDAEVYQLYISSLSKYNSTDWNLYVNQSLNATDGLDIGDYTYFTSAKDNVGNGNVTETRTVTISAVDNEYPVFSSYWDNNATLNNSGTGLFNVTLANTNGTVLLEINNTNITATNLTADVYNASYDLTTNGTYTYRWHSWGNGTNENYNASIDRDYVVNYLDTTSPTTTLISPTNNTGQPENITFNYNVTDANTINNCSLILNSVINQTNTSITKDIIQNFTLNNLSIGSYNWSVNCTDGSNNVNTSETRTFSIIKKNDFTGNTTDLTQEDITNITNLIIDNPSYAEINFTQSVDLSAGADINSYVNISQNRIEVNSTVISALNKSARLRFYNLSFSDPQALKDGSICPDCTEISYSGGTFILDVTGFSIYSARETPSTVSPSTGGGGGSIRTTTNVTNQSCISNWSCGSWSFCSADFTQARSCNDLNKCVNATSKPTEKRVCPDILFDSIIELKTKKIYSGENIKFKVNLMEVNNSDLVDIKIIYRILKNNVIVYEESETRAIQNKIAYDKEISNLDLPIGEYYLSVIIEYGKNQAASAEHSFIINESKNIFSLFNSVGIILILIALLIFIAYNWYKSREKTEELEDKLENIEEKLEEKETKRKRLKNWIINKIEAIRSRNLRKGQENIQKIEDKMAKSKIKNKKNNLKDSDELIEDLNRKKT